MNVFSTSMAMTLILMMEKSKRYWINIEKIMTEYVRTGMGTTVALI